MSKKDKSKLSKLRNLKKKGDENYTEITEGMYTAKSFLGNLNKSMGQDPDSLYPENADEIFKINDLVDLRLINNRTYIYIDNKRFVQCFNLLFNINPDKSRSYINIKNMDEASQILKARYSSWFMRISPKEAFMAHCSNIQAFFENELNTDLLHSDIAFPLLKKLVQLGYQPAEKVFAEEIVKRYNEGTWESRKFLRSEGYLKYLNKKEKRTLKKDKDFRMLTDIRLPKILETEMAKRIVDKYVDTAEAKRVQSIRILEYHDIESEFREVEKKVPLHKVLDSNKILLFDDFTQDKVWIWYGANTTTRIKFYAKHLASRLRDKLRIGSDIIPVDEGFEPFIFKILIGLESPDYEEIEKTLERLDPASRALIREYHEKYKYIDFKLMEKGIRKIKSIMIEQQVNKVTIHRKYLQEIFDASLLLISEVDGYPSIRPEVLEYFESQRIFTKTYGNVLRFFKVPRYKFF